MLNKVTTPLAFFLIILVKIYFAQSLIQNNTDILFSKKHVQTKISLKDNRAFETKKRVKGFIKSDSPDLFADYNDLIRTRNGESAPSYLPNYLIEETEKAYKNEKLFKSAYELNWIDRGPGNVSGRTRAIVVDISDASGETWFVGSVGGGIWKTTDMGKTWENKTNNLPNLATTTIIQSPSNPDIFYSGTGEGFFNADAIHGSGIFKSTDHGNTWFQLSATANYDFYTVNRMIIDPANPDIVLVCTNPGPDEAHKRAGIYRTSNGGLTWSRVFSRLQRVQDLKADPNDFKIQYASINSDGVFKSTNAGLNWTPISYGLNVSGRAEIAIAPTNSNFVYANVEAGGSSLFLSTNAGATWNKIKSSEDKNYNWLGGQGWYNNAIAVNPFNENIIFFAGIDMWKAELLPRNRITSISGVDKDSSSSFISFYHWVGDYNNTGIGFGVNFFNSNPFSVDGFNLNDSDYVAIELRFGQGRKQKAHRFSMTSSGQYQFKNYVDIPFEVWDVEHNKQLMVSFRDTKNDGQFDLRSITNSKEYITIHAIDYNPIAPNPSIAVKNGINYKNIYVLYPYLPSGKSWNPESLPDAIIRIKVELIVDPIPKAKFYNVTDGYNQYGKPNVHVDHHNITIIPKSKDEQKFWIVNGNDGGIYYSTDQGNSWSGTLSGGYNTAQFYGVDKKPGKDEYIGGTQDNGTWMSPKDLSSNKNSIYKHVIGGDGFEVEWNYMNPDLIIGGSQFNYFMRSTDGGNTWMDATAGLSDIGDKGPFMTKIISSQSDPDVILTTGSTGVWRSENFGATWNLSTLDKSKWNNNRLAIPIAVSIADPQYVWAGSSFSNDGSGLFLSEDGGINFNLINNFDGVSLGTITNICTHPLDFKTAYLTFSFANAPKILRTTNFGQSWEDLSGFENGSVSNNGFPNVATYCIIAMPYNPNILWAGTEIGLFESIDNGKSWHYSDTGLPAVSIWKMEIVDDQVILATHGRGIFTVTLPELTDHKPPVVTLGPLLLNVAQSPDGIMNINFNMRSSYDSSTIYIDNKNRIKIDASEPIIKNFDLAIPITTGKIKTQVFSYKKNKVYKTSIVETQVMDIKQPAEKYTNNFETGSMDFVGNEFAVNKPSGFNSYALHSPHPYKEKTNYYYTLTVPIIVADDNAFIEYDDIAIVEPEDDGYKFGEENFWDYVVMEANKDGKNWIPLTDGYKCTYDPSWQKIWDSNGLPVESNFIHHKINLHDKFEPGDHILIRLHLYSDDTSVGWGWVLDNLSIQNDVLNVSEVKSTPTRFGLEQNYPNPFNPTTVISWQLAVDSHVQLNVYDLLGNEVTTLVNKQQPAGYYSVRFNAGKLSSGTYFYVLQAGENRIVKKMIMIK